MYVPPKKISIDYIIYYSTYFGKMQYKRTSLAKNFFRSEKGKSRGLCTNALLYYLPLHKIQNKYFIIYKNLQCTSHKQAKNKVATSEQINNCNVPV